MENTGKNTEDEPSLELVQHGSAQKAEEKIETTKRRLTEVRIASELSVSKGSIP